MNANNQAATPQNTATFLAGAEAATKALLEALVKEVREVQLSAEIYKARAAESPNDPVLAEQKEAILRRAKALQAALAKRPVFMTPEIAALKPR